MDRNLSRYMYLLEHQATARLRRPMLRYTAATAAVGDPDAAGDRDHGILAAARGARRPVRRATSACCRRSSSSIEARYHLDEPLWRQYLRYLGDLAHGDLGPSFQYRDTSVNEIIAQGLPVDATVGLCAIALALLVGGAIGLNAALRRGTRWDYGSMALAVAGISVPVFVIAPLLILIFAVALHWLPAGDWVAARSAHLLLPVVALALPYIAYVARMVRGSALEVLAQSLHPHRARQGPAGAPDRAAPRAAPHPDAAGVVSRPGDRRPDHRLDRGRDAYSVCPASAATS